MSPLTHNPAMSLTPADCIVLLTRDLEGLQREVVLYASDETLWATLPGVSNSAGNLALHVAGNIQHFIGHTLGGTVYERNREAEFGQRQGTRDEVVAELGRALAVVHQVLPGLDPLRLDAAFEGHPGVPVTTRRFLLHLCTHAAFHLGQVGYLRRILTGDSVSTNTMTAARLG